ncbi:hypothetical protein GCM10007852_30040 [Agaribacter marinus]|uniref:Uncharacterized protein n=1 Tax=Agaribacter marinus TaxID=1431249 RepID=A0AA37SZ33_9ALTE|nr:hypothetical protein GCM10007852_30040 [Agaribacter marinus]
MYTANATVFKHKLDVQLRADDRSGRDLRYQYRVRYYPSVSFSDSLSVNGFVVTGDDFSSSHNTIDDSSADHFYLRRAFVRHSGDYGKTEVGIIPTFKGRVSSSGLSKDGWIQGIRHVRNTGNKGQFELVAGELNNVDPRKAIDAPNTIDYLEAEYSASYNEQISYEFSLERMTSANFMRTELRYAYAESHTAFAELVKRADATKIKTVLGVEGEFRSKDKPYEYFVYYSYVSDDFGLKAELTEDFLGTGHGFSAEIESSFSFAPLNWFIRFDKVDNSSRMLGGIKWSL